VGAGALVYLLAGVRFGVPNLYDEAYQALGAVRILEGYVPYRDFTYSYPPGEIVVLALAFRVFGEPSLLVSRVLGMATDAAVAACLYLLARRLVPPRWALVPPLVFTLWRGGSMPPGMHQAGKSLALLLGLVALLFVLECSWQRRARRSGNVLAGVIAGVSAGGAIAIRLDTGAAMAVAIPAGAGLAALLDRSVPLRDRLRDVFGGILVPYAVGCALVIGLVGLLVGVVAGPESAVEDVFQLHRLYVPYSYTPFPPAHDLTQFLTGKTSLVALIGHAYYTSYIYVSICVLALATVKVVPYARSGGGDGAAGRRAAAAAISLTALGVALFPSAVWRADAAHFVPVMAVVCVLLAWLGYDGLRRLQARRGAKPGPVAGALTALSVILVFFVAIGPQREKGRLLLGEIGFPPEDMVAIRLPRAGGVYADRVYAQSVQQTVEYVRQQTRPDERIFVANRQHRTVQTNDVMFYFLSEHMPVTRYDVFFLGLQSSDRVQRSIVEDLEREDRIIVMNTNESFTEQAFGAPGSSTLDDYIAAHYELGAEFGDYRVLRRASE
jgi:hypothetical protein